MICFTLFTLLGTIYYMPLPQKKFREIVFQILYSKDMGEIAEEALVLLLTKELSVTKKSVKEALDKANRISDKFPELDALISKTCASYNFERIRSVERNALRLGVYEMLYDEAIPSKVAISEAIRIAKKFATPEAAAFINAVLDAIYKASLGEHYNREEIVLSVEQLEKSEQTATDLMGQEEIELDSEE